MVVPRALWMALLVLLAGCADDARPEPAGEDEEPTLAATDETGVLRGVVIDEAITPVVGAPVTVTLNGEEVAVVTTDADGEFGLDGLEPGVYILRAEPEGFIANTGRATVVAGVDEPEVVKLVMQRDLQAAKFALQTVWDGHMVCAATGGNYCALPRLYTGIDPFNDNSIRLFYDEFVDVGRQPTFVQGEVVWESTQAVTPTLHTRWTATNPTLWSTGQWNYTFGTAAGESPIVFAIDQTMVDESRLAIDMGVSLEMFATTPGIVLDQPFTVYITAFYGYTPPDGWRFVDDSAVPPP